MSQGATIPAMDIETALPLLGGLSPRTFMRRHWQKKPLLIRHAGVVPPGLGAAELLALAAQPHVECRLIEQRAGGWHLRHGPFTRRQLPPQARGGWTLLVQGVDQHLEAAHELLSRFRFVPDARLDDLMLSFATDGGGVGPHVDSYDVFLLQLQGRRRWRIAPPAPVVLQPGLPLKIMANFKPAEEWLLEPGDMLYLPPGWAHDGVAQGACVTASIGFRAPASQQMAMQLLQQMLDGVDDEDGPGPLYRDAAQPATATPAQIPAGLASFARSAISRLLTAPNALACALGECMSELPLQVVYDEPATLQPGAGLRLDRRTRMLYDSHHLFINGQSFIATGRDARLLRLLADERELSAVDAARLSPTAWDGLQSWAQQGWVVPL